MAKVTKNKNKALKSRKEIRKNQRKQKKQRKCEHYTNRNKPGKYVQNINKTVENQENVQKESKKNKKQIKLSATELQAKQIKAEKDEHKKLQKKMAQNRKKLLEVANDDEDRNIKQLEKQLKLNKRKNKTIPKSFSVDGLDYLLEVCDADNIKNIAAAEQQFADLNNEFEDDFALVTGREETKTKSDDIESDEDEFNSENSDDYSDNDDDDLESEESFNDNQKKKRKNSDSEKEETNQKKLKNQNSEDSDDSNEDATETEENVEIWEDIYGRTRTKTGEIITNNTGKYIPPALRNNNSESEKFSRIRKQLKGLLNRLSESNMYSIASQIEQMYMSHSRNDMNGALTQLIFEAVLSSVLTPERLLLEYSCLVAVLHANVGTEVGAHFLQTIVDKFDETFQRDLPVENKELDNVVLTIAQLYNFKMFHSQLLYQILGKLTERFEEKHVECILLVLKSVGFTLRKDDPLALKELILSLQKKAATVANNNSRVKFMLDILLAIKNNNVTKIPNYDTTYSEHLKKLSKNFIRKGNYVTQLNISLEDLLKAEERGRWWIVGSAWTGIEENKPDKSLTVQQENPYNQKLLELARKQRMNTDTRRSIFCAIMTAENYVDAFEKILRLGLKNQQEREIINVLLHCSLQEKDYNHYYSLLSQKFCEFDRKYQMMFRCNVWDKLKSLIECSAKQISILAKLLTYLFLNQGLPISTLKVVQFSELDQLTLRLIRQVLLGILLNSDQEKPLAVFEKVSRTPKLKIFRESLRLFIHHFLLRNLNSSNLSEDKKSLLMARAKLVEKCLTISENKIAF